MNRRLSLLAFALGLAAMGWIAAGYVGTSLLALAMTALIVAFYLMGGLELRRFHQATTSLNAALAGLTEPAPALGDWLRQLHPSLQNAVRGRIEGERVGLPGPAMTPYLVGLLVLLGMLGTFLGMVVTLNGAVMALESTTDLPTIRAALAAPVKGLGLAFGTSVAGVAGSAMLGLVSALCRRERLQAAQALDSQIATRLRGHSQAHQREAALDALQTQARLMPAVVEQLQALAGQLQRAGQLGRTIAETQPERRRPPGRRHPAAHGGNHPGRPGTRDQQLPGPGGPHRAAAAGRRGRPLWPHRGRGGRHLAQWPGRAPAQQPAMAGWAAGRPDRLVPGL